MAEILIICRRICFTDLQMLDPKIYSRDLYLIKIYGEKCKDLIGKHDCSGYEGTAIVRGVDLARHSPLLQQQVPLAATWLPPGK